MCVHRHVEVRGQRPVSSSIRLLLNLQLPGLTRLASRKPKGSCLSPQYQDLRQALPCCSDIMGAGELISGPHVSTGSPLLTEPRPQPDVYKIGRYFQIKSLSCFFGILCCG